MKNVLCFFFGSLFLTSHTAAQLSVGSDGLSLTDGTMLSIEGLLLIPQGNFVLSNNQFQKSNTPVTIGGTVNSISNVISFDNPLTFSGTIRLYYQTSELNGNTEGALKMAYKPSASWQTSSDALVNTTDKYVEEIVAAKSFGSLSASNLFSTLPVSLISFTANLRGDMGVELRWTTGREEHSHYFLVERSADGVNYFTIGKVSASGSTYLPTSYTFRDTSPVAGTNYYRLKQYDVDGRTQSYGIRLVKMREMATSFQLYPNPSSNGFVLRLKVQPQMPLSYTIHNTTGQVVQRGTLTSGEEWIQTDRLLGGNYVLNVEGGQSIQFTKH